MHNGDPATVLMNVKRLCKKASITERVQHDCNDLISISSSASPVHVEDFSFARIPVMPLMGESAYGKEAFDLEKLFEDCNQNRFIYRVLVWMQYLKRLNDKEAFRLHILAKNSWYWYSVNEQCLELEAELFKRFKSGNDT